MALPGTLMESNGFDRRAISDRPVTQLQWVAGMNFISASTFNSVSHVIFMMGTCIMLYLDPTCNKYSDLIG